MRPLLGHRRALPVDAVDAGVLGVERALAVAQAGYEGAARILAQDVAVGSALFLERVLHHAGKPLADRAEEAVTGLEDLARGVAAVGDVVVARPWRPISGVGTGRAIAAIGRVVVGLSRRRAIGFARAWRRRIGLTVSL